MTATSIPSQLTQCRIMEQGRLAYYRQKADSAFWDNHWRSLATPAFYMGAAKGILVNHWFQWERVISHYLPREGKIIEAGCGLGQVVLGLQARGYDIEGVEWGEETVAAVKALQPNLPIRTGDVTELNVPDGYYNGYISLGVVEHRKEGPEPFLREAARVLAPGGIAFISVPYMHPLRALKAALNLYQGNPDGMEFYQYAYREQEFSSLIEAVGLQVIDRALYEGFKGVKDEIPVLLRLFQVPQIGPLLKKMITYSPYIEGHFGHMIMLVAKKPER